MTALPPTPLCLSPQQRQRKRRHLAIALAPLLGSVAFNGGLQIPGWGCPLMRYVGLPCPGWGLTRSFMALARGDWSQAIGFNAFGPVLFVGFLLAAAHLAWELYRDRPLRGGYLAWIANPRLQVLGFLMLLGYHGARVSALWRAGDLAASLRQAPLGGWVLQAVAWMGRLA